MRLLYVCKRFPKYSETFVLDEVVAMLERGHDVSVVSLERPHDGDPLVGDPVVQSIPVDYVDRSIQGDVDAAAAFPHAPRWASMTGNDSHLRRAREALAVTRLGSARQADHVHAHFAHGPASVAMLVAGRLGVPFSFTAHARDLYELTPPWLLQEKALAASFVVTVGRAHASHLRDIAGPEARIEVVHNGVDAERFRPAPRPSHRSPVILSVARFVEKKGLDVLIRACAGLPMPFTLWLMGGGPERETLGALADRLGVPATFTGRSERVAVATAMRDATVFALPCRITSSGDRDGLPVSLVEAMASGLPVVSTPVGAIPEAVEHERNGLLVPPDDPSALRDALARTLSDPEYAAALSERARVRAVEMFSRDAATDRLEALFSAVTPAKATVTA